MDRTNINGVDETTSWFDRDAATAYGEASYFDGSNSISKATGSPHRHETLYQTRRGTWVLESSSAYENEPTTYRQIEPEEAAEWLVLNEREIPPALTKYVASLEV